MPITSINYESYIPQGSPIIGKTIGEVEAQSGLKIDHYHKPPLVIETRFAPTPDIILKPGMYIKICDADPEKLSKFCQDFNMP